MPAPTTADELLDLLQKSSLVDEPRLRAYVQKLRDANAFPADPSKLAQFLVRDALLTYFQAEQLLQGKYKRFSLGKYKVLEKLGAGGMGTVFLCEHKLMRRRVAVKVLPVNKAEDKASLDRFQREAKAVAALDHPNIVRAYDIDQDDNLHFLVMEWVDGTNLQDLIKKFGPLDVLRACHYIYGTAVGLQHAYEIGLIHRDIKPGNILLDRSGVVKILDLGLARLTHDTDDNLTRQNDENVLGTADYLAPEQALDSHTVDIRADIYSLGATFYFLLTGSAPFPEGSVAQKLIWHQNRPPRALKSLRTEVPDEVVAVVEKMMAKDPARRYQTPAELMQALAPWVSAPIPPPAEREMPTLSPAVAGGQTGTRPPGAAPTTMVGGFLRTVGATGPMTLSGMPTAVGTTTPAPLGTTPAPQNGPAGAAAVWATLDADTQSVARGDTAKPEPAPEALTIDDAERASSVVRRKAAHAAGRRNVLLYAAVGAALFLVAVVGVYFVLVKKKSDTGGPGGPGAASGSRKITVSKGGGENAVPTLREALLKAAPGDTIVITEPKIVEPPLQLKGSRHKDVTVESATPDGKPAVIEFAGLKGGTMLNASEAEGFRLRNVELDGKGVAEFGVQTGGVAPGATFEGVTVRNVTRAGFYLWNVTGTADRPVVLDHVRVILTPATADGGILFYAQAVDNKFVAVRNSRFEGPGRAGLRFDGPAVDVTVTNNRFYNLTAAAAFARPSGRASKGTFANNTVRQAQFGLQFEAQANEGSYEFKVALNYFSQTGALLTAPAPPPPPPPPPPAAPPPPPGPLPVPGLTSENNLHDAACNPGNPPLASSPTDVALPNPNPDDDATFLRFPPNAFPTVGPNKVRVGAH